MHLTKRKQTTLNEGMYRGSASDATSAPSRVQHERGTDTRRAIACRGRTGSLGIGELVGGLVGVGVAVAALALLVTVVRRGAPAPGGRPS